MCYRKKLGIKAIWLTSNQNLVDALQKKGYNVYNKNSIYGFWYGSRAGATFINCGYDDVNKYCIRGSLIIQLWHGIPLKKIKNDDIINKNIQRPSIIILIRNIILKLLPFLNERYDLIISKGSKVTDRFESAFKINRSNIVETGYPRMDIILSEKSAYTKTQLYNYHDDTIEKIILYAPTHRVEGTGENDMLSHLDFDKFNRFLQKHKSIMLIKMHYYESDKITFHSVNEPSHIHLLNSQEINDINRILNNIDVLITDYSSVFYDFLVLRRPILFAPIDIKEYQGHDREFYGNYQLDTPGEKCHNWDEIRYQLKEYFSNIDYFQEKREKVFQQYFNFSDNQNCKRIIDKVSTFI
ncbi:hypothetical protein EB821_05330 [Candidatus Marinimicrobia bacterium PRS2]|nr:hypothetical protein EB821_05330 [Candidatus Marinimicrobia bacterium PRS2]